MNDKKTKFLIPAIFLFALALRLLYMFFLRKNYFFYNNPSDDVIFYQEWAKQIARQDWLGVGVFYGMPLYPYFLAMLDRMTLGHWEAIRILQLTLGSINCLLVYLIAEKLFSKKAALLSALLVSTNFMLIYYDWLMMPVTILIFLSCVIVYSLISLDLKAPKRQWFILGIILGLSILGDGKFLILLIFIIAYLLLNFRLNLRIFTLRALLPLTIGVFIILFTVCLRNKIVGGDFVFISGHSGINFYLGNNPSATGAFKNPAFLRPSHQGHSEDPRIIAEAELKRPLSPSEVNHFWKRRALAFMTQSPRQYVHLLKNKFMLFLTDDESTYDIDLLLQGRWKKNLDVNGLHLILPFALLGMILSFKNSQNSLWLNFFILSQLIFSLIFFVINRHRATVLPFLIIFESFALCFLVDRLRARNLKVSFIVILTLVALFLFLRPKSINPTLIDFVRLTNGGLIYAQNNNYEKAREQYFEALRLQPLDTNTLYNLANSFLVQQKYQDAIFYYTKAITLNPFDVDVTYNMAYAYEKMGDSESALRHYQEVLNLQPGTLDALFRMAEIYRAQGACDKSLSHYERIIQLNPNLKNQIDPLIKDCKSH